ARSEWDYKMAAVVASVVTSATLWFNITMGPLARADFPDLKIVDQAYPLMITKYLPAGLIGIVVAGLVAAGYSTFDSIGIGISSLFVRDLYARFFVKNATDAHYTLVGKLSVPFVIALGFVYVPFLGAPRSEEHTSELQSLAYLVCRLLLEKKKFAPTRVSPLP